MFWPTSVTQHLSSSTLPEFQPGLKLSLFPCSLHWRIEVFTHEEKQNTLKSHGSNPNNPRVIKTLRVVLHISVTHWTLHFSPWEFISSRKSSPWVLNSHGNWVSCVDLKLEKYSGSFHLQFHKAFSAACEELNHALFVPTGRSCVPAV